MPKLLKPAALILALASACAHGAADHASWTPLFPDSGVPEGWVVRAWDDVSKPAPPEAQWKVDADGVLHGSNPRGTWLVSEATYGDFELAFEWKLGERGNSGCGIRFPDAGDPAFDGLEIQMVDPRYNEGRDAPDALSGAIYKASAPIEQFYKPTDWNAYIIRAEGSRITVTLNAVEVQQIDLDTKTVPIQRHNGEAAPSLRERPRSGHIGFQELSRGGGHVMIRNARIRTLD